MSLADFVTPDLLALVTAEIDEAYAGTDCLRPDPRDVIAESLDWIRREIRDLTGEMAGCLDVDDCTARVVVVNRFADWMEA